MQWVADDPTKNYNFPLSDKLKGVFNIGWKESIPFLLRLAAQERKNQWLHDSSTGSIIKVVTLFIELYCP